MKLFIWAEPYHISYGTSLVIAVAETVEQARIQAASGKVQAYGKFERPTDMSAQAKELGEPTRVLDLPCAEWYEWEE